MISRKTDMLVGAAILGGSLFLLYDTRKIPGPRFEPMGSAVLPRIVLATIAVLAVIEIARAAFHHFRPTSEVAEIIDQEEKKEFPHQDSPRMRYIWLVRTLVTLLVLMAYTFLLTYDIGNYYVVTFIFSAGLTAYLADFNLKYTMIGIMTILVILGLLYLLSHTMGVVLPTM